MVRVTATEGRFAQELWIEVKPKGAEWIVRPARGCSTVPTPAVQKALDLLADAARKSVL